MSQRHEKMRRADIRRIEHRGPLAQARYHLFRLNRVKKFLTITNLLTLALLICVVAVLLVEVFR